MFPRFISQRQGNAKGPALWNPLFCLSLGESWAESTWGSTGRYSEWSLEGPSADNGAAGGQSWPLMGALWRGAGVWGEERSLRPDPLISSSLLFSSTYISLCNLHVEPGTETLVVWFQGGRQEKAFDPRASFSIPGNCTPSYFVPEKANI